jgi:uncharacterized protein
MQLIQKLYDHCCEKARTTRVACLTVGLVYTAAITEDGGMGVAYTYFSNKRCCATGKGYRDYEGERAIELLAELKHPDPLHRSMGLALVNALNHREALACAADPSNEILSDALGIGPETRVAMVGLFRPLVHLFEKSGAVVEVLDDMQGVGDRNRFYGKLDGWAEVLVLTSTSILNHTAEDLLGKAGPGVKVAMVGPSTPMTADAFSHLPVHLLAGTVPLDQKAVLKAVRHGAGTPVIHRFSRKVYLSLQGREDLHEGPGASSTGKVI